MRESRGAAGGGESGNFWDDSAGRGHVFLQRSSKKLPRTPVAVRPLPLPAKRGNRETKCRKRRGSPCCIDAGTTRMESSRISRLVRRALPPITEPHRARAAFFLSRGLLTCATVVPLRHFVIHGSGTSTPRPAFTFFVASTSRSETGIFRACCSVNTQSVRPTIA